MQRSVFRHRDLALSVSRQGAGQPFVFQHGLCGAASQPAEVFPDGGGWQGLTLECCGHGQSDAGDPDDFSIATFADDVAAFIDSEIRTPVVVGGISMGAAIALRLAVRRPRLVRALVLARPAWIDTAAPANLAPNLLVGRLLAEHDPATARDLFDKSETAARLAREAPDNLSSLRGFFSREPLAITRALLLAIAADGPGVTRREISGIKLPTLVVGHGQDAIHPLAMAQELARLIPGARLAEITPKAQDISRYRADFRASLASFLKDLPP